MSDKLKSMAAAYTVLFDRIRDVGRQYGYAIAIHGSMIRDMDLIAVPWTEHAWPAEKLIEEIIKIVPDGQLPPNHKVSELPHGRKAWTILIGYGGLSYIDISVMPIIKKGRDYENSNWNKSNPV